MEGLGINLGYLLMQLAMFGIIFVTLRVWVYKPVLGMIEKRREKLSQSLEDAKIAAEARANAETEAAAVIAEAQSKASQIVKDANARAQQVEKDIKANAEVDIQKMRAAANVRSRRNANARSRKCALRSPRWQSPLPKSWWAKRWMRNVSTGCSKNSSPGSRTGA